METEARGMVMSKSILNVVGQGVGEWNRWALFSEFMGQVIGIEEGSPLAGTTATPSTCSEL